MDVPRERTHEGAKHPIPHRQTMEAVRDWLGFRSRSAAEPLSEITIGSNGSRSLSASRRQRSRVLLV
jgi:hypothetical protein